MTTVNRLLKAKRKTEERFAPGRIGVQRSMPWQKGEICLIRALSILKVNGSESSAVEKKKSAQSELRASAAAKKSSKPCKKYLQ